MAFQPKLGCPMCSIVSTASHAPSGQPLYPSFPAGSTQPEVLWKDENFTAYREKANPVSSKGHIIIAFNMHVPSIYTLSSSDLPLLVSIKGLANRLLSSLLTPSSPSVAFSADPLNQNASLFRIGFITPPFKDNKIPITDHLHAHAFVGPGDMMGWWRAIAYGPLAWYGIEDLIAEIRESTSNNRIKSGYENRASAPIDRVPNAGARAGTANGIETSEPGLATTDLSEIEEGERTPSSMGPSSTVSSPTQSIPHLRV